MEKQKSVLYISYDGMTDPLGQSQVIPYLLRLSSKGYTIYLVSCEKKDSFLSEKTTIKTLLDKGGINWIPLKYTKTPPVISTLRDLLKIYFTVLKLVKQNTIGVIHCRSYLAALIGLRLKKRRSVPFIFDMRGFWADERVEGKIWNLRNPIYRIIYAYFKRKEKEMLEHAACIVSLTESAKNEINSWPLKNKPSPIKVIPCCVDDQVFDLKFQNSELKDRLNILPHELVISYLGSIGTWYMLHEMLWFFQRLRLQNENWKFLFITPDSPDIIYTKAEELGINKDAIIVVKAKRHEVPEYLALSNISIFFIISTFSKKASSPTKLAELLAMGIPVICNSGVGDIDQIVTETNSGYIVKEFSNKEFDFAINKFQDLIRIPSDEMRELVKNKFSLDVGVERYSEIYSAILK